MYHSMCVVMCVYEDPQKASHVSGVRESHTIRDSTIREICQFNLQIRKGLKPVSLHAIDSAWSLLYLVMVCKSAGLAAAFFPYLFLPHSLFPSLPPSLPPSDRKSRMCGGEEDRQAKARVGRRHEEDGGTAYIMSGQSRCFPTASACTRQKSLLHWYHSRDPHQEPTTNVANSAIGGVNALNVWPQVQRVLYYM